MSNLQTLLAIVNAQAQAIQPTATNTQPVCPGAPRKPRREQPQLDVEDMEVDEDGGQPVRTVKRALFR